MMLGARDLGLLLVLMVAVPLQLYLATTTSPTDSIGFQSFATGGHGLVAWVMRKAKVNR